MRRRSSAGGKPPHAQGRKTAARKSNIAQKAVRPRGPSIAREETEVARLIRERDDALARQTATSEILRVISQSPTDARPVCDRALRRGHDPVRVGGAVAQRHRKHWVVFRSA